MSDFEKQRAAIERLNEHNEPIRHATAAATVQHGHGGVCCCLMEACRQPSCNVNIEILRGMHEDV